MHQLKKVQNHSIPSVLRHLLVKSFPSLHENYPAGFKDFIIRGNVVDLCVAVVLGDAFTTLIEAFVNSFVTPLFGIIGDAEQTDSLVFVVNGSVFTYGEFITAAISFVIIVLVVYYIAVLPLLRMMNAILPTRSCPKCFAFDIPCKASVCKECGSRIPVVAKDGKSISQDEDEEIFEDTIDLELGIV